jgi:hypothetical protein
MAETKKLVLNKAKYQKAMNAAGDLGKSLQALAKQAEKLSKDYKSVEKANDK